MDDEDTSLDEIFRLLISIENDAATIRKKLEEVRKEIHEDDRQNHHASV